MRHTAEKMSELKDMPIKTVVKSMSCGTIFF